MVTIRINRGGQEVSPPRGRVWGTIKVACHTKHLRCCKAGVDMLCTYIDLEVAVGVYFKLGQGHDQVTGTPEVSRQAWGTQIQGLSGYLRAPVLQYGMHQAPLYGVGM